MAGVDIFGRSDLVFDGCAVAYTLPFFIMIVIVKLSLLILRNIAVYQDPI